ncbi:hypothetical protein EDC04DRAFT_771756 [Pisolithus marmoratus]|nr:hypothetical protein EDC04DRAFT_771756 [Pisolithus marmoratus]
MVNYTIICSIPDRIFMFMLHLKLPLEKWDYLKKHFSSIPRPESWVAAEQGMQQSSSQPEQSTADETTQGTCDSHNKTPNPPSEEEGFSPNDCAETETQYPTLETEVVDVQGVESNLPVEEEDLQGNQNACTEIPTGHLEPKMDIVDVQWTEGCLLVVETGITDPEWLDKHANMLKVTDERSRCMDDEIVEH